MFDINNEDHRALLRLALAEGIGPLMRQNLLDAFGSPAAVFQASEKDWAAIPGIGAQRIESLQSSTDEKLDKFLAFCKIHHIDLIPLGDKNYPQQLTSIPDAPGILFVRGTLLPEDSISIGVVGTRHSTHYGNRAAHNLSFALAQAGVTIISGLARGIDTQAHIGALDAHGRTIAVLASGQEKIYPPENEKLANAIVESGGALVTEALPGSVPRKGMFPQRNRIISGLSLGTLVVEADVASGALITARHAMEQNREVFAVPGQIDSRMSRGANRLIKDGARLVQSVDDILDNLGPLTKPIQRSTGVTDKNPPKPAELKLNEMERKVYDVVCTHTGPTPIDELIRQTGLPTGNLLAVITALEIRRLIKRVGGQSVIRN